MSEKGCIFELSSEFKELEDFIYSLAEGGISKDLLPRITKEVLNMLVESCLNAELAPAFKQDSDLEQSVIDVVSTSSAHRLDKKTLATLDDFLFHAKRDISARLKEMFYRIDMKYALWQTRQISQTVTLVEYKGDFRIMEWHERNGVEFDESVDVTYEFSIGFLYKLLDELLVPHRGRYAGKYFSKCLGLLVNNVVEEAVFSNGNKAEINATELSRYFAKIELSDFIYSRREFENFFPLMTTQEISSILSTTEQAIAAELTPTFEATISSGNIRSWFINDKVLTVIAERTTSKINFVDRIKSDINISISNGDYIPPKLRNLADI